MHYRLASLAAVFPPSELTQSPLLAAASRMEMVFVRIISNRSEEKWDISHLLFTATVPAPTHSTAVSFAVGLLYPDQLLFLSIPSLNTQGPILNACGIRHFSFTVGEVFIFPPPPPLPPQNAKRSLFRIHLWLSAPAWCCRRRPIWKRLLCCEKSPPCNREDRLKRSQTIRGSLPRNWNGHCNGFRPKACWYFGPCQVSLTQQQKQRAHLFASPA